MAVQSGVFAALMAQKDYSGTEKVFEGKAIFFPRNFDSPAYILSYSE